VDPRSNEYPAIVEFSPYQRPYTSSDAGEAKPDSKSNTLEQDADFLRFVEIMDKSGNHPLPTCEAMLEEIEQREKEKIAAAAAPSGGVDSKMITPLIEFMRKRRSAASGGGNSAYSDKKSFKTDPRKEVMSFLFSNLSQI
jgi:hypothetical protein